MSTFNNPFGEAAENPNIDEMAEEMAIRLKILNSKNSKLSPAAVQKFDISDNSVGSFPQVYKNSLHDQASLRSVKRNNPIKVALKIVGRKRVKTTSECEGQLNDESQFVDSLTERKITDFFGSTKPKAQNVKQTQQVKNEVAYEQSEEQAIINNHPVIKSLRQKISKKKKMIQQLDQQTQWIKQKNLRYQQEFQAKLENQKNILIQLMSQKYSQRIYNLRLKQIQKIEHPNASKRVLSQLLQKIQILKNEKSSKKNSKNKVGNQQSHHLEIYGQERQSYLNFWRKKLDSEKLIFQKQVAKINQSDEIQIIQQKYYPLPNIFLDQDGQRIIFQKIYLPLYCRTDPNLLQMNQSCQMRVLNIKRLRFQNLIMLPYPKIMKIEKRMQMKSYIKQVHEKSKDLNDNFINSIFTNNTIFSQISTLSQEMIIMGRGVWQQDSPPFTLKNILNRYESLPQNIAKYIIKTLLRAHQRIKKQLNIQAIILPQNIIFNQRNDVKIDNWIQNQTYRFLQFSDFLTKDFKYLYFPPEYKITLYNQDHNLASFGIWSVGVILYEILYGKKPFQYSAQQIDYQQFYMMLQIEFPIKPQITDCCKELLKSCLCKPQNRISSEKALKHSFFDSKK